MTENDMNDPIRTTSERYLIVSLIHLPSSDQQLPLDIMRVLIPALLAPLLATAFPATKPFAIQGEQGIFGGNDAAGVPGFDLDLNELRLVQFSDDEPPV
jgi:hypothetical protein